MAKHSFNFRNSDAQIDIAGHAFTINVGDPVLHAKGREIRAAAMEYSEKVAAIDSEDVAGVEKIVGEIVEFTRTSVDNLLGEGAYKTIMSGRKINMIDNIELLGFVLDVVNEEVREFNSQTVAKYSAKRAGAAINKADVVAAESVEEQPEDEEPPKSKKGSKK